MKNSADSSEVEVHNFDIEVKNFGPISYGNISIKPLTIFIGPNQCGKSFISTLIYSFYNINKKIKGDSLLYNKMMNYIRDKDTFENSEIYSDLASKEKDKPLNLELIKRFFVSALKEVYTEEITHEITRCFSTPLYNLKLFRKNIFYFKINKSNEDVINNKFEFYFKKYALETNNILDIPLSEEDLSRPYDVSMLDESFQKMRIEFLLIELSEFFEDKITKGFNKNCYYMPAARSGILQGHKALFASIMELAPFAGMKKIEIPTLSGIVSDFIKLFLILPAEEGELSNIANLHEQKIINGTLYLRPSRKGTYPEIIFVYKNRLIPLHNSSSSVSELAPIILFVKYLVKPGDILIIEEPEAHLHPEHQLDMAKFIVNMIREGIRVIITTHSDYLLEQINYFMLLSKISAEVRKTKYGLMEHDFLEMDEVAVHVFEKDKKEGYKVKKLKIDKDLGIPQDEFLRVNNLLYKKKLEIQHDLLSKK